MLQFHRDWNITQLSTKLSLHVARSLCKTIKTNGKQIKNKNYDIDIFIYTWNNFMKS